MQLEALIKLAYKKWQAEQKQMDSEDHLDPETVVCFLEGELPAQEEARIKSHLTYCDTCAEILVTELQFELIPILEPPDSLVRWAKELVSFQYTHPLPDIYSRLKEKLSVIFNIPVGLLSARERP